MFTAALTALTQTAVFSWGRFRVEADKVLHGRRFRLKRYVRNLVNVPVLYAQLYRLKTAPRIEIRHEDAGFCANVLVVLDTILHAHDGARIRVDWTPTGSEKEFRYGDAGANLWDQIFEPLSKREEFESTPGQPFRMSRRVNPLLISSGKDLLSASGELESVRRRYHRPYHERILVHNEYVLGEVDAYRGRMHGHRCVGVHKRVNTRQVATNQRLRRMPTSREMLHCVNRVVSSYEGEPPLIYLATDDVDCVEEFTAHFGERLLWRPEVQRIREGHQAEVHFQDWDKVGLKDACDVLIDALLLAECVELVHLSSNVSTFVGFVNPTLKLTHYDEMVAARRKA